MAPSPHHECVRRYIGCTHLHTVQGTFQGHEEIHTPSFLVCVCVCLAIVRFGGNTLNLSRGIIYYVVETNELKSHPFSSLKLRES